MERSTVIAIWDIWIRVFHWIFAASILFMLLSGSTGIGFFDWHREIGELIFVLITFRIVWGFIGSENARLSSLFQHPAKSITHLRKLFTRKVGHEQGHNAAGAIAVLIMLLLCLIQAVTGFFIADEDELIEGVLYGSINSNLSDLMYRIHKINAELIQVIVAIHVLMILVYLFYAKVNLIRPMITGKMTFIIRNTDGEKPDSVRLAPWWQGAILMIVIFSVLGWWLGWYS